MTRADVLAVDLRGRARLAEEALDDLVVVLRLRAQKLERDALVELQVDGGDHHAHAADAEHALDPVLAADDLAHADGRYLLGWGCGGHGIGGRGAVLRTEAPTP